MERNKENYKFRQKNDDQEFRQSGCRCRGQKLGNGYNCTYPDPTDGGEEDYVDNTSILTECPQTKNFIMLLTSIFTAILYGYFRKTYNIIKEFQYKFFKCLNGLTEGK